MARGRGRGRIGAHAGSGRGRGRGRGGGSVSSFIAPHTGRQAGHIANKEAGAEFNGEIRQTREQAKGSRKRERDLGSWYAQLASDYQGAENQGSAALKSVESATSSQLAEAGARSSADQARLASEDEGIAKLVGGPRDTAGLDKIAQAGQAAAAARVDQAKLPLSEQANFVGRLGADKAAARMGGIEARIEERNRRTKLLSDVAGLRKEKGAARVANKEKIRESDRGYVAELRKLALAKKEAKTAAEAAAASAALAQLKAAHEARQDAIGNRQAQERIRVSRSNAKISAKNARTSSRSQRATEKHYEKENKGGLTASERNARHADARNAAVEATNLYKAAKKPPKDEAGWAAFAHLVAEQAEISPAAATAAVAKLREALAAKAATHNRRLHEGKIPGH